MKPDAPYSKEGKEWADEFLAGAVKFNSPKVYVTGTKWGHIRSNADLYLRGKAVEDTRVEIDLCNIRFQTWLKRLSEKGCGDAATFEDLNVAFQFLYGASASSPSSTCYDTDLFSPSSG